MFGDKMPGDEISHATVAAFATAAACLSGILLVVFLVAFHEDRTYPTNRSFLYVLSENMPLFNPADLDRETGKDRAKDDDDDDDSRA